MTAKVDSALRLVRVLVAVIVVMAGCLAATTAQSDRPEPLPPPPDPSEPLLPVSHWRDLFDGVAENEAEHNFRLSRSSDSWDFYNLSYYIDAHVSMFEATGDPEYADVALELAENMIDSARRSSSLDSSQFEDNYLGWTSEQADVRGQEVPLFESYAWRYVTRLLRAMEAVSLHADPEYRDRYQQVLEFSEVHIFDKWYHRGPEEHIYRSRMHMVAHWAYIALDLAQLTNDPSRRDRYLEVVDNIDNSLPNYPSSLRDQLRASETDPRAYWWSDVWGEKSGPGQDVAHGNGVISYIVESRQLEAGWTAEELTRFARTFTSFVLPRDGRHPAFVDGSGSGNGWIADGFVKLGRYDPAIQAVLEDYPVQNSQFYAAMAHNAEILNADDA